MELELNINGHRMELNTDRLLWLDLDTLEPRRATAEEIVMAARIEELEAEGGK